MLKTREIPKAAELVPVLMGRTGQPVTFSELRTDYGFQEPEQVLRALVRHAATKGFPLPIAVEPDSAQFMDLPTLCSLPQRRLTDQELQGCGLGALTGRYRVSVGANRVSVRRLDEQWRRRGKLLPPTSDDYEWRLEVRGSNMPSTVVIPLTVDPAGDPGGLRAVIGQLIADHARRRAT